MDRGSLILEPGAELGPYRIDRLIGEGGMSTVFLAEDVRLRRRVAIKVPSIAMARDPAFRERFLRESRIAASIDHPYIIPIYDTGDLAGRPFIAMRYVEGEDLRSLLDRESPLDPTRAVTLCAQVGAALDAAHARGLVHRDVKPGNVLVVAAAGPHGEDHCYLCDFGLSKHASSATGLTATGQIVGTVDYIAPEQIKGERIDGRSDVYSLTCMLYECLIGSPPYHRDSEVASLWAHVNDLPPRPHAARPDLPPELDDIIASGLAKDPADRFPTSGELVSAAAHALCIGLPATQTTRTATHRHGTLRLRRPAVALAVALALAACVAVGLLAARAGGHTIRVIPNSLARIDPKNGRLLSDTALGNGSSPNGLAADAAGVWSSQFGRGGSLTYVDPNGLPSGSSPPNPGAGPPTGIAVRGHAVWILHGFNDTVTRIDLTSAERAPQTYSVGRGPDAVVYTAGAAWIALRNDDAVQPITPEGVVGKEIPVGPGPVGLAASNGDLWVADSLSRSLSRVDLRTRRVTSLPLPSFPACVVAAHGSIWVSSSLGNEVTRLSALDGSLVTTITRGIGTGPSALTATPTDIWVASPLGSTISEIDIQTNRVVERLKMGSPPDAILAAHGAIWVTAHPV